MQRFLNDKKLSRYEATVTDYFNSNNTSDNAFLTEHKAKLPFLVHVAPKCCQEFQTDGNEIANFQSCRNQNGRG